jgi:dinuclear metal center YbgI/SA1388 family protein
MLRVGDVARILETWAPRSLAWERDNVGLQVGDPGTPVRRILVTLDVTEAVAAEAARHHVDLIVAHHPPLYHPLRSLDTSTPSGRVIAALIQHSCALYAAHTNLDAARGGTSHALAETLGLSGIRPLLQRRGAGRKIVTFVPEEAVNDVAAAMASAGGGIVGNYGHCSFRSRGTGTFKGNNLSSPAVGRKGILERVSEIRLEMPVDDDRLPAVLAALRGSHPYEEVAYDIYPLESSHSTTGMGAFGRLPRPMTATAFLRHIKKQLKAPGLRYAGPPRKRISSVAVCGGAGGDMLGQAIAAGADAFVTSDLNYHAFLDGAGPFLLVDAGHFETEYPVVGALERFLRSSLGGDHPDVTVTASRIRTSPIVFV